MADDAPIERVLTGTGGARRSSHVRYIALYFVLGAIGSLAASAIGTLLLFSIAAVLSGGLVAILVLMRPWVVLQGFLVGLLWAAPVNFLLLPIAALLFKRAIARDLLFPIIGLVGGTLTMWLSAQIEGVPRPSESLSLVIIAGAIAGCVSGLFYARALNELDR